MDSISWLLESASYQGDMGLREVMIDYPAKEKGQ